MPAKPGRNRSRNQAPAGALGNWANTHWRVACVSASRLLATPVSSFLTVFVIAVSLLLPALLFALNGNLRTVTAGFQENARISLYLVSGTLESVGLQISDDLLIKEEVSAVQFISPAAALEEFSAASGLGEVLTQLPSNPLPATILVTPATLDPASITALAAELAALPEVELAQVDSQWLQRREEATRLINVAGTRSVGHCGAGPVGDRRQYHQTGHRKPPHRNQCYQAGGRY